MSDPCTVKRRLTSCFSDPEAVPQKTTDGDDGEGGDGGGGRVNNINENAYHIRAFVVDLLTNPELSSLAQTSEHYRKLTHGFN